MKAEFIKQLEKIMNKDQIMEEELMSNHTTFRIGGPAEVLVTPHIKQAAEVIALCKKQQVAYTIIGNGSNLLVGDGGIRGVVIEFGKYAADMQIDAASGVVTVEAGALLSKVANAAADASLTGLEFAAGIPGSIGGAVVMNAGAYGGEMKDVVVSVTVLTAEGEVVIIPGEQMEFAYRHSLAMERHYIILGAVLQLKHGDAQTIRAYMKELRDKRVEKQPLEYPSAGSTFKRPEGYFAGKLIMDAGLRGFRVGGAEVSAKHCGFVVNRGDATAKDVSELMEQVTKKVFDQFQVRLEPEVRRMGEFS